MEASTAGAARGVGATVEALMGVGAREEAKVIVGRSRGTGELIVEQHKGQPIANHLNLFFRSHFGSMLMLTSNIFVCK